VVCYLLEKREYLTAVPGKAYFLTAVKHTALRRLLYAGARYTVFMDSQALLIAEAMTHPRRANRRLPEPVAT
jgi:hypothetical protein